MHGFSDSVLLPFPSETDSLAFGGSWRYECIWGIGGMVGKAIGLYESQRVVFEVLVGLCIMVNFVHEVTA